MYFTHLDNPLVQHEIKQLCRGRSGVYRITNLKNGTCYVGSALTKTPTGNRLYFRFRNHFFNHHKPFPVRRAILKYGIRHFSWEILEFTDVSETRTRETYYIQTLKPRYNILETGTSSLGYLHTEQTKEKMKHVYSDERRQRIGNLHRNKTLSPEIRQKLAQTVFNRTQEQKDKHQKAYQEWNRNMFSKPTQVLGGETHQVLGTYPSLTQACQ